MSNTSGLRSAAQAHSNSVTTSLARSRTVSSPIAVVISLTQPDELFRQQRQRMSWFILLISTSAFTAIIGLAGASRAWRRQLRLNELKSNFISTVSHELRAPIASIRLLTEGLANEHVREPGKQRQYFKFILQECRRLSGMIENVLDFSRIEQGRKEYEFEPTDLAALFRETIALYQPNAAARGVRLEPVFDPPMELEHSIEAVVDGRALQQALGNLIDNAIKHSPPDESVRIGMNFAEECESKGSGRMDRTAIRFRVEDRGEGIPPEEHEQIFERFYRRGSELRRDTQGAGIGLSLVRHVAAAHGGKVSVRSAPGEGSVFTIELPVNRHPERQQISIETENV